MVLPWRRHRRHYWLNQPLAWIMSQDVSSVRPCGHVRQWRISDAVICGLWMSSSVVLRVGCLLHIIFCYLIFSGKWKCAFCILNQREWPRRLIPDWNLISVSSSREVEEELEVVWQAATRENQQMMETLLDSKLIANLHSWSPDEEATSPQPRSSRPLLFTPRQSPGVQRKAGLSDSLPHVSSLDEKQKNGLDFYC